MAALSHLYLHVDFRISLPVSLTPPPLSPHPPLAKSTANVLRIVLILYINLGRTDIFTGFPDGSANKEPTYNTGDTGETHSTPGLGSSPDRGNGNPLQYSCLGNPMDRGTWWAIVCGVAKNRTGTEQLSTHTRYGIRRA